MSKHPHITLIFNQDFPCFMMIFPISALFKFELSWNFATVKQRRFEKYSLHIWFLVCLLRFFPSFTISINSLLETTHVFLHLGYVKSENMKNTHAQWALIKRLNGHGYFLHLASLASGCPYIALTGGGPYSAACLMKDFATWIGTGKKTVKPSIKIEIPMLPAPRKRASGRFWTEMIILSTKNVVF